MKPKTAHFPPFIAEINGFVFEIKAQLKGEAEHNEFRGMPLPHYVYIVTATRKDMDGTTPISIEYHGNFHEWARGKPNMHPTRALNIVADFIIDAAMSITKSPEQLLEAWAMDTDEANRTWRMFEHNRETLQKNFRMTTNDIVMLANALFRLQADGRLAELIV